MTSSYAEVIGDPVAHSKSPQIHNFWLRKLGLPGEYRCCEVGEAGLGTYFAVRRKDPFWRGCNITMPHKLAAAAYMTRHESAGGNAEPINIAVPRDGELEGFNSDTQGIVEPLQERLSADGEPKRARTAVVIGAGGVLPSVIKALHQLGYAPITVVARDPEKLARVQKHYREMDVETLRLGAALPRADLLLNASPLGMSGFPPLPYDVANVLPDGLVFDLIYHPLDTALLQSARAAGRRTIDGLEMLVAQAAVGFELFFGHPAPREHDAELRQLLVA